jgi:site-specific DNA-cytosine methylase
MMRLIPTDGATLDLFTGAAGGWTLGMHRAGYHTIAACEIDPWRRSVLAERWCHARP